MTREADGGVQVSVFRSGTSARIVFTKSLPTLNAFLMRGKVVFTAEEAVNDPVMLERQSNTRATASAAMSGSSFGGAREMLDLFYVGVLVLFFAGCWQFTKACDKL